MHSNKQLYRRDNNPEEGKWTSDSKGAPKFCGWSMEGMKQFHELCMILKQTGNPVHILMPSRKVEEHITKKEFPCCLQ